MAITTDVQNYYKDSCCIDKDSLSWPVALWWGNSPGLVLERSD